LNIFQSTHGSGPPGIFDFRLRWAIIEKAAGGVKKKLVPLWDWLELFLRVKILHYHFNFPPG